MLSSGYGLVVDIREQISEGTGRPFVFWPRISRPNQWIDARNCSPLNDRFNLETARPGLRFGRFFETLAYDPRNLPGREHLVGHFCLLGGLRIVLPWPD